MVSIPRAPYSNPTPPLFVRGMNFAHSTRRQHTFAPDVHTLPECQISFQLMSVLCIIDTEDSKARSSSGWEWNGEVMDDFRFWHAASFLH